MENGGKISERRNSRSDKHLRRAVRRGPPRTPITPRVIRVEAARAACVRRGFRSRTILVKRSHVQTLLRRPADPARSPTACAQKKKCETNPFFAPGAIENAVFNPKRTQFARDLATFCARMAPPERPAIRATGAASPPQPHERNPWKPLILISPRPGRGDGPAVDIASSPTSALSIDNRQSKIDNRKQGAPKP